MSTKEDDLRSVINNVMYKVMIWIALNMKLEVFGNHGKKAVSKRKLHVHVKNAVNPCHYDDFIQ